MNKLKYQQTYKRFRKRVRKMKKCRKKIFKRFQKTLIDNPTNAEVILKNNLEKRITIVFQKRLGLYFYDFYIPRFRVLIELDGSYHDLEFQK